MFLEILTVGAVLILVTVMITQVVIPLFRGTPLFPMLRKEQKLANELSEAKDEVLVAKLETKISATKKRAKEIRQPE